MPSKILIVDDEPDIEDLIRQRFRKKIAAGEFVFEFARNGLHALEHLAKADDFALVFTDINMAEMDGLTLLEKINELNPIYKTIVVSAYGDMNNIRTAMNKGAFDFLTKPIDFTDFEATLTKSLRDYQRLMEGIHAKSNLESTKAQKEKAEQSEKFKQLFLANMSHEIRTPLNAIKGMTFMLLKDSLSPEQKKNLEIIQTSTDNLIVIINDILDVSKIEAGKLELEKIDFSLFRVIQNVYDVLHFKAEEKKLAFITHLSDDVPPALLGDPVRLGQVLMNLAGNAIKFTDEGNITIEANLKSKDNKNAIIEINIKDTGIGIKEDQLDKIFESFSQATSDTYRKYGGTGLGLTISRQLVGLMGGSLSVKSKPGEGTCFFFEITMPLGDAKKLEQDAGNKTSLITIKNTRVLLFEDNLFNQVVAKQILNATIEGVQLDIAENGLVGLEKLKKNDYDIVLMDIQMPELNGYEASQKIRTEFTGFKQNIPILAMTANAIKEETEKCLEYGMDDHITKPFEPADLLNKMSKLLNKNK